jgi:hypothetical protein
MATIKQDYFGGIPYVYSYEGELSNEELNSTVGTQLGLGESMYSSTIDGVLYIGSSVLLSAIPRLVEVTDTL